jgi:hypothetical protein
MMMHFQYLMRGILSAAVLFVVMIAVYSVQAQADPLETTA